MHSYCCTMSIQWKWALKKTFKNEKKQLLTCGRKLNFKRRFMKFYNLWPSLITTAQWTFPRWMVYIFIYDSPFSNHNIFYKLDKLTSHLTRRKANINCCKGHSVQYWSILSCHQNWIVISWITHLTRIFQNLEINCQHYGINEVNKTASQGKLIEHGNPNCTLTRFSLFKLTLTFKNNSLGSRTHAEIIAVTFMGTL